MKPRVLLIATAALFAPGIALAQSNPADQQVKRGEYIVTTAGCHDCHTPLMMGPEGPAPDMKQALSGHPEEMKR